MEEPFDEPLTELSQIDSLQNLDTARMSLRWALERLHSLEGSIADLTEKLRLSELVREKAQRENEGLKELHEAAPSTETQRRRLAASMEEYVLLSLAGKLDLAPLLARELKVLNLREDLESAKARVEAEHAARRRELEEEFKRLQDELRSASQARSRQMEDESLQRRESLDKDLSERARALAHAEEDLQRRERELAVRSALFEDRHAAEKERSEISLGERRGELEREHEARRLREEEEHARRASSALTAWDQERASLRLEIKNLETLCAQQIADIRQLHQDKELLDASVRRAEEAFARENARHQAIETQTAAGEQERRQAHQDIIVLLEKEKIDLASRLASAESNARELGDAIGGLERDKDQLRLEAQRSLAERQEEFAHKEENLRGHLEWLEQCLEEAKTAAPPPPPPLPPPSPSPVQEELRALQERLRIVESAAEKSAELLERESVWREDMTHTWDLLISQSKAVWLSDQEKENLAKEFKLKNTSLEKDLAQAKDELCRSVEDHSLVLNRLHELEAASRSLAERESRALFDNAKLRGDVVSEMSKARVLEETAASLEAALGGTREDLRRAENNLRFEAEERQSAEGRESVLAARVKSLEEELGLSHDRLLQTEENLRIEAEARLKSEELLNAARMSLDDSRKSASSSSSEFAARVQTLEVELGRSHDRLRQTEENLRDETEARLKNEELLTASRMSLDDSRKSASSSTSEFAARVQTLEVELGRTREAFQRALEAGQTEEKARHKAEECLKETLAATEQAALETAKLLQRETQKREALDAQLHNAQMSLEALAQRTKKAFSEDQLETQMLTHEIATLKSKLTEAEASQRRSEQAENILDEKRRILEESLAGLMEERDRLRAEAQKPREPAPETARVKELEAALVLEAQRRKKLEDFISGQKGGGPA